MNIGKRIKTARKKKGITQEILAKEINRQKSLISEYENDVKIPTLDNLLEIAKVLEVNVSYLIGEFTQEGDSLIEQEWMNLCLEIKEEKKIEEMIQIIHRIIRFGI